MSLSKHLVQRGVQGTWQLRVAIPKALQILLGKRERIVSLRTSDRSLAERRAIPILAKWRAEEDAAQQAVGSSSPIPRTPDLRELEEVAVLGGYELTLEDHDRSRHELADFGELFWELSLDHAKKRIAMQARLTATGDRQVVRELADELIDALGYDLPNDSAEYRQFCDLLNQSLLAAEKVNLRRLEGEVDAESDLPLVQAVRRRDSQKAKSGQTIMELFENWAAELLAKREKRQDTVANDRKVIAQFAEFIGKHRDISSVTPLEVAEYRDLLRDLPPKWASKKGLKELPVREAAAKARALGLGHTAFTTVNKHLSTISPLYKWLIKQPAWAGLRNPCDGLFHDKVKGKNPRPPFTTDQLNRMLASPLFTGFESDGSEHVPGNVHSDDWRKWIPLVCLFTGARIGEIAQLRIADVRKVRGVWFIYIRPDEEVGMATKNGLARPAVVHRVLEELGFIAFVERQRSKAGDVPGAALFPELTPNSRGHYGAEPSRWWRTYLKLIGIKQGGDGFGAHSFRHLITDRLRSEAELLDNQIEVVLGHNQKTTTGGYGILPQGTVTLLKGYADLLTFEGVDFSKIPAA